MILRLLRVNQWYKNLVIFLPIIFAAQLQNLNYLLITIIGFVCLCFVSSSNYIINDILDKKNDQVHPEKRKRPIASGRINTSWAFILSLFLLILSLIIAEKMAAYFLYSVVALFVSGFIYNISLKKEPFADILSIAINFVIRAVAGAFIINVRISPWLILCTFFLSLFLSIGKRKTDMILLQDKAIEHKKTYKYYDKDILNLLLATATVALIMSYSLYSFLSIYELLIISLPFAIYVIFRYAYLIQIGDIIARQPNKFLKDKKLVMGIFLWLFSVLFIIY